MHKFCIAYALLGMLLLVGCTGDGPSAPTAGRLGLDAYSSNTIEITSTPINVGRPRKVEAWSSVYANANNLQPHGKLSETVQKKWKISIGEGISNEGAVQVVPIVHNGIVYTLDTQLVLQASRLDDGKRLWRKELPVSELSSVKSVGITLDNGNLYIVSGDGQVFALDTDGNLVWNKKTNMSLRTGPVISGQHLFVTSLNNDIVALNKKSGKELWSVSGEAATTTFLGMATPAISQQMIIVPTTTGMVNAYSVDSGIIHWTESMWHAKTFSLIQDLPHVTASPVVYGQNVYLVGNAGKVGAYRLKDGYALWTKQIGGRTTPVVSGKSLFMIDNQNDLKALDTRTGNCYWNKKLSDKDTIWQGPVLASGKLILTSSKGDIIWLDAISGSELRREVIEPVAVSPVIIQDKMLVLTKDGNLYLYQ